jgi:putative ABC transport system permease protein
MWSQALTIALVVASGIGGFVTTLSAVDSLALARDRFYARGAFADVFAPSSARPMRWRAAARRARRGRRADHHRARRARELTAWTTPSSASSSAWTAHTAAAHEPRGHAARGRAGIAGASPGAARPDGAMPAWVSEASRARTACAPGARLRR